MHSNVPHPVQWNLAPSRWISLNTDGAVCPSSRYARIGGLFCDSSGSWLHGFGRSVGITDAFSTELWAIYEGLLLAWKMGFEFVQVQSDCSKAISALKVNDAINSSFALVRSIIRLCQRGWVVDFVWISREANHVVDYLIKRISQSQFELVHFDSSPPDLAALLMRDIDGTPYCRSASN
ncbi:hypothetical protein GQ457_18G005670 [Hibiscus cannabinus]